MTDPYYDAESDVYSYPEWQLRVLHRKFRRVELKPVTRYCDWVCSAADWNLGCAYGRARTPREAINRCFRDMMRRIAR